MSNMFYFFYALTVKIGSKWQGCINFEVFPFGALLCYLFSLVLICNHIV